MRDALGTSIAWAASGGIVAYPQALAAMEARVAAIAAGEAGELIWLLEHPPLYTAGTSAKREDLLPGAPAFPVFEAGRGGQYTYHGPGQRVIYVMLDVRRRGGDVRAFVALLEACMIDALAMVGVTGVVRPGRVGVWVERAGAIEGASPREDKIAAIGIRLRRWISFHGMSVNVAPDLSHFAGIVPCGIRGHGVTSLADLGSRATMADMDAALRASFTSRCGAVVEGRAPID